MCRLRGAWYGSRPGPQRSSCGRGRRAVGTSRSVEAHCDAVEVVKRMQAEYFAEVDDDGGKADEVRRAGMMIHGSKRRCLGCILAYTAVPCRSVETNVSADTMYDDLSA